jgi:hypothetical protein
MLKDFQIKGLEKIVNSSSIMDIYPMVDHIDIRYNSDLYNPRGWGGLEVDIFVNDPTITKENMYDKEFDPHYLVDYHIKQYFPYFNINKPIMSFVVWDLDGNIITSFEH